MIYNPKIIIKILSTQNNYIARNQNQMLYYTDLGQMWYDTIDNNRILLSDIVILQFERQRTNYIPSNTTDFPSEPSNVQRNLEQLTYSIVYIVETNSLYKYQNGTWSTIYGVYGSTTVAQTYLPDGTARLVNADDVTTNGILNDGSVVIRDNNKMICGYLKSDGYTFNILGLIGGQINIDPSGKSVSDGCLQLNSYYVENLNYLNSNANLNADLIVFGDIIKTKKSNWNKQYRLITESVSIVTNTLIKTGSTITKNSILNGINYIEDTKLTEDIITTSGMINTNSKIYINSVINDNLLTPPYLFDYNYDTEIIATDVNIINNILLIATTDLFNTDANVSEIIIPLTNIDVQELIDNVDKIEFINNETSYEIEYKVTDANSIRNVARIVYYKNINKVKVLP